MSPSGLFIKRGGYNNTYLQLYNYTNIQLYKSTPNPKPKTTHELNSATPSPAHRSHSLPVNLFPPTYSTLHMYTNNTAPPRPHTRPRPHPPRPQSIPSLHSRVIPSSHLRTCLSPPWHHALLRGSLFYSRYYYLYV